MKNEMKKLIVDAALSYMKEHSLTNADVVNKAGINSGYLSNMLRSIFETKVENKLVAIGDKWFYKLAEVVGLDIKKRYVDAVATRQFTEIISALDDAKQNGKSKIIIGFTGAGKSFAIDKFENKYPSHTFRITVSSLYKLPDMINELADKLSIDTGTINSKRVYEYSLKLRHDKIIEKIKDIKRNGGKPIIILDEGENMEISLLKATKALFDGISDHCPIVIIGTEQLLTKLLNLKKRNRDAVPQLYRRFKAGRKDISPITTDDKINFIKPYVKEAGLQKLLCALSENYGELNDYLEPALREADDMEQPLTEELFRIIYNMPK